MPRYEMHKPPARDEAYDAVGSARTCSKPWQAAAGVFSFCVGRSTRGAADARALRGPLEVIGGDKGVSNQCYHA